MLSSLPHLLCSACIHPIGTNSQYFRISPIVSVRKPHNALIIFSAIHCRRCLVSPLKTARKKAHSAFNWTLWASTSFESAWKNSFSYFIHHPLSSSIGRAPVVVVAWATWVTKGEQLNWIVGSSFEKLIDWFSSSLFLSFFSSIFWCAVKKA